MRRRTSARKRRPPGSSNKRRTTPRRDSSILLDDNFVKNIEIPIQSLPTPLVKSDVDKSSAKKRLTSFTGFRSKRNY